MRKPTNKCPGESVNWVIIVSEIRHDNSNHKTKTGEAMTSIEREKMEAMARKAKVIRDVWLREREQARAVQITSNAEIRRGWREFDNRDEAKSVRLTHGFGR